MSEATVELRDVFCVHRTNEGDAAALAGMNLTLGHGEVLSILGPSGAGKSTVLRVTAGFQQPSAGIVRVLGRDIGRMPARARSRLRHELMGFLGQHSGSALSPDLRVRAAVALPLTLRGVPRRETLSRVAELLEATGLADRADALPAELSGGERQRFALCAALAHRPALLLADEPTGELDSASADAVRALIVELARVNGASVILVTHDPATADIADRMVRIAGGRIVADRIVTDRTGIDRTGIDRAGGDRAGGDRAGGDWAGIDRAGGDWAGGDWAGSDQAHGDRTGGQEALVVDRGWVRLPLDLLAEAGIGGRASVRLTPEGVVVTRAADDSAPGTPGVAGIPGVTGAPRATGTPGATGAPGDAAAPPPPPPPPERWTPVQVELRDVARAYGRGSARRQVLAHLTHVFAPGQLTVVTGRSGTGKTTLLKLVAGLDRASSGLVLLDGQRLADLDGEQLAGLRRRRIGYLSQEPSPIEFLSAQENTVLALRLRGWDADGASARAVASLTRAGLAERARQRAGRLSAGEAQRLALARALAGARGLLVVDEPTSRQDESNARAVADLLTAAARQEGQTVICSTHDPALIARADHVIALDG